MCLYRLYRLVSTPDIPMRLYRLYRLPSTPDIPMCLYRLYRLMSTPDIPMCLYRLYRLVSTLDIPMCFTDCTGWCQSPISRCVYCLYRMYRLPSTPDYPDVFIPIVQVGVNSVEDWLPETMTSTNDKTWLRVYSSTSYCMFLVRCCVILPTFERFHCLNAFLFII